MGSSVRFPGPRRLRGAIRSFLHGILLETALAWIRSLRPRLEGAVPPPASGILVLWHEDMLSCLPAFARRGMRVLISRSGDGEWGARAAERLGYRAVRGSTSRGGAAALRALARDLREHGGWAALVADGPRGPRRACKPGAVWLSRASGLPVTCVAATAAPGFRLGGWDRCRVPFPFARVRLRCSAPFHPAAPAEVDAEMRANARGTGTP